ncbi:hypothetical protein [uncultured Ruminococcus sp.]|uniref:hypothetical protein n=1 Tax=uncultured Ruminococcus sp. TaxID=165186 RepID=UPI0025EC7EAD|nr:hypothetical protein [uncultured Ruminococcus sp.]
MNNNLDYDLDAVMEEWREENKYRDEADRDHIPEDKDNRTIKNVIKAMEERYFDGKHIFRNGGKNSDFLFRYEIKELLVAILKLELSDPFKDARASKTGVSSVNINTIERTYSNLEEIDKLRSYERRVLSLSFDSEVAAKHIETLRRLSASMSRFFLMDAMFYNNSASAPFVDIINQIDVWTANLCMRQYEIAKYKDSRPIFNLDLFKMRVERHDNFDFVADMRLAIVKAIKRISSIIYEFDENNVCKRRKITDVIAELETVRSDSFALLRKQAEEVDNITAVVESGDDESRRTMDSFYEVLFEGLYPYSKDYAGTPLPLRWSDSYIYNMLPKYFYKYLKFMTDPSPSFEDRRKVLKMRQFLSTQYIGSFSFFQTLVRTENELLTITEGKSYGSFKEFDADTDIRKVIDEHFCYFITGVQDNAKLRSMSLDSMKEALRSTTLGKSIADNYDKLYHQCEEIVSNVFAMVLKLEAERQKMSNDTMSDDIEKLFASIGFRRTFDSIPDYTMNHYSYQDDQSSNLSDEMKQNIESQSSPPELDDYIGCEGILKAMGLRAVRKPIDNDDAENEEKTKE